MEATSTWQRRLLCLLILLVSVGGLGGCARAVSWQVLEKFDTRTYSNQWTGERWGPSLSYSGSDADYHYFRLYDDQRRGDVDDVYVRKSATPVELKERPYSTNPTEWLPINRDSSSVGFTRGLWSIIQSTKKNPPDSAGKASR
jgi:hypothetical protein